MIWADIGSRLPYTPLMSRLTLSSPDPMWPAVRQASVKTENCEDEKRFQDILVWLFVR